MGSFGIRGAEPWGYDNTVLVNDYLYSFTFFKRIHDEFLNLSDIFVGRYSALTLIRRISVHIQL
jgi:hypothetical protein